MIFGGDWSKLPPPTEEAFEAVVTIARWNVSCDSENNRCFDYYDGLALTWVSPDKNGQECIAWWIAGVDTYGTFDRFLQFPAEWWEIATFCNLHKISSKEAREILVNGMNRPGALIFDEINGCVCWARFADSSVIPEENLPKDDE